MKKIGLALIVVLLVSVVAFAYAALSKEAKQEVRTCPQCGMNAAISPLEVQYGDVSFASLECWNEYAVEKEIALSAAKIVDFPTATAKTRKYVALDKAYFVQVGKLKNTMPPYFPAFSSEEAAKQYATDNKSAVVRFADVQTALESEDSDAAEEACGCCGGAKTEDKDDGLEEHHH